MTNAGKVTDDMLEKIFTLSRNRKEAIATMRATADRHPELKPLMDDLISVLERE